MKASRAMTPHTGWTKGGPRLGGGDQLCENIYSNLDDAADIYQGPKFNTKYGYFSQCMDPVQNSSQNLKMKCTHVHPAEGFNLRIFT